MRPIRVDATVLADANSRHCAAIVDVAAEAEVAGRAVVIPLRIGVAAAVKYSRHAQSVRPALDIRDGGDAHRRCGEALLATTLAAYGSFAYFGTTGRHELDDLHDSCEGHCEQSKVDAAWTKLIIADVSLGVAVLGTGLSTWLFVKSMRGKGERPPATQASVAPLMHGLRLGVSHRF